MLSIQALREKKAAKAKEIKNLLDKAGESFNLDKKDREALDALYADVEGIDDLIERIEKQNKLEAKLEDPNAAGRMSPQERRELDRAATPEARDRQVLDRWLRGGFSALTPEDHTHIASRPRGDQSASDPTKGGYTAPDDFSATLLERLAAYGGVRQSGVTVITTSGGNNMNWPTVDESTAEGEILNESGTATDDDIDFGLVSIGAHKYSSKGVAVPIELLQDTRIDLIGFINRALANRIARIQNRHFTTGTGVNQPKGFITAAATGKTTASGQTTSLIYDDFVDLEHSIDPAYRASGNCRWQMHDNTLKAIKKIKDSTGRPLWVPGMSSKDPDTLLRYAYVINQHMASSIAASAKTVAFGDFSKYLVRDVMAVTLMRFDDSAYAKKGQVGFLAMARADGNVIDALDSSDQSGAFKLIVQASS